MSIAAKRITILGKSGSGKSTLARKLSQTLDIELIDVDSVHWRPNWQETPDDEMRSELDKRLPLDGSWIVDNNYDRFADIHWQRAELIIWLDYPLLFVLWRLLKRTLWRAWSKEKCCGENYENFWGLLSWRWDCNMLVFCVMQHGLMKKNMPAKLEKHRRGEMIVFKGDNECEAWLREVQTKHKAE